MNNADTANAISALIKGFRQGYVDKQNQRMKEEEVSNSSEWRKSQMAMIRQKTPTLSGGLFNTAFQKGAGFNPELPEDIPLQAGQTYSSLLDTLKTMRQQSDSKREHEKTLSDLRKSFREREKLLQGSIDKSREKILSAQTNLLSKPDDPQALKTIMAMQRQEKLYQKELSKLRKKASSVGLIEFGLVDDDEEDDDLTTTSPQNPGAFPTLPVDTPNPSSVSSIDELMKQMGIGR